MVLLCYVLEYRNQHQSESPDAVFGDKFMSLSSSVDDIAVAIVNSACNPINHDVIFMTSINFTYITSGMYFKTLVKTL